MVQAEADWSSLLPQRSSVGGRPSSMALGDAVSRFRSWADRRAHVSSSPQLIASSPNSWRSADHTHWSWVWPSVETGWSWHEPTWIVRFRHGWSARS